MTETVQKMGEFDASEEKLKALRMLFDAWVQHMELDQDIVFPSFREAGVDLVSLSEAAIEYDLAAFLLSDLQQRPSDDEMFVAGVNVLLRMLPRLIELEETPTNGLFAKARKTGVDLKELGKTLQSRMPGTEHHAEDERKAPSPRHLRSAGTTYRPKEIEQMRGNERERDERGRFVEDDDRRGYRGSESRGSQRRDDDDDGRGRGWYGDSRGHAEAAYRGWEERRDYRPSDRDDDDRRSGSRSRSNYDDDDRRGRDGGQGGWFGDSERHSQASQRGWDNPDHGPSGWYGDREGHRRAAQRGWDNPDHGPSGWYGDREGHSRAAQRGWDNPDHGRSGWYGDPEGHSQASRRGWEERRSSSRYDDDDDDRRRGSRRR
jgi:hypothetical protein